jgi:hypothetical protein
MSRKFEEGLGVASHAQALLIDQDIAVQILGKCVAIHPSIESHDVYSETQLF